MEKTFAVAKELKVGKYVLIDDVPCRVVNIESSAPGKHGAAKMRITAMGIFNRQKKTLLKPSDADIEIPIIERKAGQVMSVNGNMAQLMNSVTYEMLEMEIPEELSGSVQPGKEIEYMESMNKRMMTRVR
ncbi:MAG: translation initiation factor IF-5A [Candidatus Micrarchaeota archaeon]